MNLSKSYEYFKPETINKVHIIGCGSVGSTIAENLARCGVKNFVLWDFDIVEDKNIVNQMFTQGQVGMEKTEAVKEIIKSINDEAVILTKPKGWNGEILSGFVFLCVDNIEIRQQIVDKNFNNMSIKSVFDFRTALESAQMYAADWGDLGMKENLKNSMSFTHDEANTDIPTSACGVTLGLAPVVRTICALGVANLINFCNEKPLKKFVEISLNSFILDAF